MLKGVFWYVGKYELFIVNIYNDKYLGLGKILWNIYCKYGFNYKIWWLKWYGFREKLYEVECELIFVLKCKYLDICINIFFGG